MMFIFLTILSCTALKLSDPVALRDITDTEDNQSLQAWCAGTGCVMPFTPASCLSWCDWNVDKQADAEARGAFGNPSWKKQQVKATSFNIELHQAKINTNAVPNAKGAKRTYYFQAADADDKKGNKKDCGKDCATNTPIFPGGDEEKKFSETALECKKCYKIASGEASPGAVNSAYKDAFNDGGLPTHAYIIFVKGADAASPPEMQLRASNKAACEGDIIWDPRMTATETMQAGTKKTVDADGKKLTPSRAVPKILTCQTKVVGKNDGNDNANKALKRSYWISFSGTSVGGIYAPSACA